MGDLPLIRSVFAQTYVHDSEKEVNHKLPLMLGQVRGVTQPEKTSEAFAQKFIGAVVGNSSSEKKVHITA